MTYGTNVWHQSIIVGLSTPGVDLIERRLAHEEWRTEQMMERVRELELRANRFEQRQHLLAAGAF